MTKKEMIEKNISMTFNFIRFLAENPEAIKEIPDNAELQFIDKDFPIEEGKVKGKQIAIYRVVMSLNRFNSEIGKPLVLPVRLKKV